MNEEVEKKNMIARVFGLPPIEERKMSQGILRRVFLPPKFTLRSDDTYIYYLCARSSLIITSILLFLNWASLVWQIEFNFYYFKIELPEENFIEAFANSFSFYTATILLCTVVPFYLVMFRMSVNPKKVDIMWWVLYSPKTKKSRLRSISALLILFAVSTFGMFMVYSAPLFWMSYQAFGDLSSSYGYMFIISILYIIFYSIMPYGTVFSLMALYRYIGPYSGELSSRSIQGGKQ